MKPGRVSGLFVFFGQVIPTGISRRIALIGERIALGGWYKTNFRQVVALVPNRFDLLKLGCDRLKGNFTYLEFGVSSGDSMRFMKNVTIGIHDIELHGYDTFTGLPDSHHDKVMTGSFSQEGATPEISGVIWHKGLFSDTFSGHELFLSGKLFLMFDADLYSSTKYVLGKVLNSVKPGDLMYFDDLHIPNQERLALTEFIGLGLSLELVARSIEGRSALFEVIGK